MEERARHLEQAQELRAEADQMAAEMEPGDVQFDEESGEGTTTAIDRERDLALSMQAQVEVEEIDHALAKIEAGTYGVCEHCGQNIPKARLEGDPPRAPVHRVQERGTVAPLTGQRARRPGRGCRHRRRCRSAHQDVGRAGAGRRSDPPVLDVSLRLTYNSGAAFSSGRGLDAVHHRARRRRADRCWSASPARSTAPLGLVTWAW